MIKIELNKCQKEAIEKDHWDYIESKALAILEQQANSTDKLLQKICSYLLDKENGHKRLKEEVIFGNVNNHISIISQIESFIYSELKFSYLDPFKQALDNTQPLIPTLLDIKKETLTEGVKKIEEACKYFTELLDLFDQKTPIQKVKEAKDLVREIRKRFSSLSEQHREKSSKLSQKKAKIKKELQKVFNYKNFTSDEKYGAYNLTKKLGVNTCPYCNRAFIHTSNNGNGKTRPQLDHFFSQSDYPYLALSVYNLIPSCYVCNSNLKGSKDFFRKHHLHPYREGFGDDAIFKTDFIKNKNGMYEINLINKNTTTDNFDLKLEIKDSSPIKEKIENSNNTFLIDELYQNHKDYVLEILRKSVLYTPKKIQELVSDKNFKELFKNEEELTQILIGNYIQEENLNKRILSKLTKDIWEEYGLNDVWKV